MFETIPKLVYNAVYNILVDHATFSYIQTKQRGFIPKSGDILHPSLYPWVFIEFGGFTTIELLRMPTVWEYEFTVHMVAMTVADRGDVESLVYNDGSNVKKGIGDIAADIGTVFWLRKNDQLGISGVRDWNIARVGTPSVLSVQRLLASEFVRGIQVDFVFQINEGGAV